MYENYLNNVIDLLEKAKQQEEAIKQCANVMAKAIIDDKLIHVVGCGHSQMFSFELFYRAGGLVPVNAILPPALSVSPYAPMSTYMERQHGFAKFALDSQKEINKGDVIIVASASGRNAVPVEFALEAKERGLTTIGLTSFEFTKSVESRHKSGKKLIEVVDFALDLGGVAGDAIMEIPNYDFKTGATSSIVGFSILNTLVSETIEQIIDLNETPKVWTSINAIDGEEKNRDYAKQYKDRITVM